MPTPETIYIIGSWARPEFADARAWLRSHSQAIRFSNVATVAQAILDGQRDPDQILLVQTRPGQFQEPDVAELRRLAPLARVSLLLGSWSEGETRSGKPLLDVPRFHWHDLRVRMSHLSSEMIRTHRILPVTASEQVRWRNDLRERKAILPQMIGVYSADPAQVPAICEALAANGHSPVPFLPHRSNETPTHQLDVFIWDDAGGARVPRVSIKECPETFGISPETPVITLRTFLRIQDVDDDKANGVFASIAKPFQVADLLGQIEFCTSIGGSQRTTAA